ncbi:MAG: hypothetical protein ACLPPF_13650 [Rhodomicrobium sp.]
MSTLSKPFANARSFPYPVSQPSPSVEESAVTGIAPAEALSSEDARALKGAMEFLSILIGFYDELIETGTADPSKTEVRRS